jgi:hypothetical protein
MWRLLQVAEWAQAIVSHVFRNARTRVEADRLLKRFEERSRRSLRKEVSSPDLALHGTWLGHRN